MGDAKAGRVRLSFNPQLRVEFRRATVTSDAGLLLPRELDEQLGLSTLVLDGVFSEARPGRLPFTPRPHRATTTWRTSSPPSAPVSDADACSPAATWSPPTTRPQRTRPPTSRPS